MAFFRTVREERSPVMKKSEKGYVSTRNPCSLCAPLGASIVFRGIQGALPILHGSQGCSTYIRRYLISHFNEPIDIASSNFSEKSAIFGGKQNLMKGLENLCIQYEPELIGVASTCLSETIGDDVPMIVREFIKDNQSLSIPKIVHVSTPSYSGNHMDGFHNAVLAVVSALAEEKNIISTVGIFPGFVSPADIRYLRGVAEAFCLNCVILPDYSESLDGGPWEEYQKIQKGGVSLNEVKSLGGSRAVIEFGHSLADRDTAATFLKNKFCVERFSLGLPIGIRLTDSFFGVMEDLSLRKMPPKHRLARSRLIDSYIDGHKYLFEKRALVFGEEDLVISVAAFLFEIGVIPVLCATNAQTGTINRIVAGIANDYGREVMIREGVDFENIKEEARNLDIDFIIGNSKGYYIAREMGIPLIRIGFPIHDRIDSGRIIHLGYSGTQQLFDRITNAIIQVKQDLSPVGYNYM